jgi:hypothetical protein
MLAWPREMEGIKRVTVTPADASLCWRAAMLAAGCGAMLAGGLSIDAGLVFFSLVISCNFPPPFSFRAKTMVVL